MRMECHEITAHSIVTTIPPQYTSLLSHPLSTTLHALSPCSYYSSQDTACLTTSYYIVHAAINICIPFMKATVRPSGESNSRRYQSTK